MEKDIKKMQKELINILKKYDEMGIIIFSSEDDKVGILFHRISDEDMISLFSNILDKCNKGNYKEIDISQKEWS